MSATFWIRRKRLAAQQRAKQMAENAAIPEKEAVETPKKSTRKGGAKNDNRTGANS